MEFSATLEKNPEFSGTFFFISKDALCVFWDHPEELKNLKNIPI